MKNKLLVLLAVMFLIAERISAQNTFVIAPYIQNVSETDFHVLFETSRSARAVAYLAEASDNILKPPFRQLKQDAPVGMLHNLIFSGLQPGGEYVFRAGAVNGRDTLWGQPSRFNMPDYQKQPIVCTIIGDTQDNPAKWGHFAKMMINEQPNFVIHVGDLVGNGLQKRQWTDEFFPAAANLLRSIPLYPVLGNHDENSPLFFNYFDVPQPKWFYTKRMGDALFVFMDTNIDIQAGSKQYRMLEDALRASPAKWKIVVHHHPIYDSSGGYDPIYQKMNVGDPNVTHLRHLYETYGVDVVFNGHNHNYERSMPIYEDKIQENMGVTYITTGGGGGEIDTDYNIRSWFMSNAKNRHHYMKMTIWGNRLLVQAIDSVGVEFDRWDKRRFMPEVALPAIESSEPYFFDNDARVVIRSSDERRGVRYQINDSPLRTVEGSADTITLARTATVSAYTSDGNKLMGRKMSRTFTKITLMPAQKIRAAAGVKAEYCEGMYVKLPDFNKEKIMATFTLDSLNLNGIRPRRDDHWATRLTGTFTVPETAVYRVRIRSYDGSRLIFDGKEVINNDGRHNEIAKDTYVALEKGVHTFEVQYFDYTRRETLQLWMNPIYEDLVDFNTYIERK